MNNSKIVRIRSKYSVIIASRDKMIKMEQNNKSASCKKC